MKQVELRWVEVKEVVCRSEIESSGGSRCRGVCLSAVV
jgi:hypothetical protein